MSEFDPLRAQREIVAGLMDVHNVIVARAKQAERRLAEAEADSNALMKIERFGAQMLDDARAKLKALETEAEARAK